MDKPDGECVVNAINLSLATNLGVALRARERQIATAESCTGGGIAEVITRVPGSSAWFEYGFVTYSNIAKIRLLDVDPAILKQSGAVSEAVVRSMALGAMRNAQSYCAVAVSGIAGPGGGTPAKPVGTVWLAWCSERTVRAECRGFGGDRDAVREQTVQAALEGMLQLLATEDKTP